MFLFPSLTSNSHQLVHNICPTLRLIPNLPNILSVQFFNQFFNGLPKRKYILICLSYFPWHFKAHWSPTYGFNLSCSSGIINPQATPRPLGLSNFILGNQIKPAKKKKEENAKQNPTTTTTKKGKLKSACIFNILTRSEQTIFPAV